MSKFGAKEIAVVLDAVISLVVFFVGKYAPLAIEDVKFVIAALQPVIMLYIGLVYKNDVEKLRARFWAKQ